MFGNPGILLSPYYIFQVYVYNTLFVPLGTFFSGVGEGLTAWWATWFPSPTPVAAIIEPVKTVSSLTDEYIARRIEVFQRTFSDTETDYNSGVDVVFYIKKELSKILEEADNPLERKWRSKLLFESTPRGNIVMHYDPYKQGFVYYSDQNSIPYALVNAVAMKYVVMFRCRDFFVDEHVLPENAGSAIARAHKEQENAAKQEKAESEPNAQTKFKPSESPAFAKFKSYNTVSAKANGTNSNAGGIMKSSEKRIENTRKEQTVAPKRTNSLVSMGKMSNFSFIQKIPMKCAAASFQSDLLPDTRMSYADFKRKIGKATSESSKSGVLVSTLG